jgi:hypothetical protein
LEEIQGNSFSLQDGAPIALDLEEAVSIVCAFSILAVDGENKGWVHCLKGSHGRGKTCDHQRLLSDDACKRRYGRGEKRGCCDVAEREVFFERKSNGAPYVGNWGPDHRLSFQHGAQLLLTAGEHGFIPP